MITTKEQELKALEQIKRIVSGLGEGSYIAAAFEGCFEMAEDNIGNDFACSYMTDAEAKAWICEEYDFNPDKLTIIHEVDEEEVNRHGQVRRTGKKIDRRPVYCATDYHYIRFNTTRCMYEVWNGELRPFYD